MQRHKRRVNYSLNIFFYNGFMSDHWSHYIAFENPDGYSDGEAPITDERHDAVAKSSTSAGDTCVRENLAGKRSHGEN